jgi:hypothetical protein
MEVLLVELEDIVPALLRGEVAQLSSAGALGLAILQLELRIGPDRHTVE